MYCPDTAKALRKAQAKRKRRPRKREYCVMSVRWNNQYTRPPEGMPFVLWAVCVDWPMAGYKAFLEQHAPQYPGYSETLTFCDYTPQPVKWSMEAKARNRQERLRKRVEKKAPLFAAEFIRREIDAKPSYFQGYSAVTLLPEVESNPAAFLHYTAWPESYAP